jgi:excisionase family DNA binding protein
MNNAKAVEQESRQSRSIPMNNPKVEREFVSVLEAARMLCVSEVTVRRFLGQKKLRRYKVGARTLLDRAAVMGLVRET